MKHDMNLLTIVVVLSLSCLWLSIITSAQEEWNAPVLDTDGQPLRRGVEYFIKPAAPDSGGLLTLISPTDDLCPLVVGQGNATTDIGPAATFAPFDEGEDVVRKTKNFQVTFSGANICAQSTTWEVGRLAATARRRLIGTGLGRYASYFYLSEFEGLENAYFFEWCPVELCPLCRFACGSVGLLVENGKRLFALDGNGTGFPYTAAFPVVFQRVYYTHGYVKQI